MRSEVLIALLSKLVDERLAQLPSNHVARGPRGQRGPSGSDGRNFVFSEHEEQIRSWAKEFALKFQDFSAEEIEQLRGPRGRDGKDGTSFIFDDYKTDIDLIIRQVVTDSYSELKLDFADLTADDIEQLRGPRGRDGKDFRLEEHLEYFKTLKLKFADLTDEEKSELKLRYDDLSPDQIAGLRGPRGRDGHDGKDFIFDDHIEFFNSLRLKFSDLTEEEKESLTLRFSKLSSEEKESLKLKFSDLTLEDKISLRGVRGARGQKGRPGDNGERGERGVRGLPGPRGITGLTGERGKDGIDGEDGEDGKDAPHVVDISVDQYKDQIVFEFDFSDGTIIRTDKVKLPAPINVYGGGGRSSGGAKMNFETHVDEPDAATTYVGKSRPGATTDLPIWQIQRILIVGTETIIEFADGDDKFDNIWDNRAVLVYT